jgi:ANTAR domain-containing protein/GAF domain-containing protein
MANTSTHCADISNVLHELVEAFELLENQVRRADARGVFDAVTTVAVRQIDQADWASITVLDRDVFRTESATHKQAREGDQLQYAQHSGPCVDALVEAAPLHVADTATERRWPSFIPRVREELGVRSMLSFRMTLDDDDKAIAGLNLYAQRPHAFDEQSLVSGLLVATTGAIALTGARQRQQVSNLRAALEHSREIGIAIGILMWQYRITRDQAFNLLRISSQHTHRKLRDVAADVAESGALDLPKSGHGDQS